MGDFLLRAKMHYSFSGQEQKEFLITAFVTAFILTFRKWGTVTFDAEQGIINILLAFVLVAIIMFVHISAQKLLALKLGFVATYTYWLNGLFAGLILAFFSYGFVPIILTGTVLIEHHARLRLGRFRYGLNYKDLAKISFAGIFANLLMILLMKPLVQFSGSPALQELATTIIWMNVLIAAYGMLPFKNTNGLNIFMASRPAYVFCLVLVLIYSFLVLSTGIFSLILAAVLALFVTWIFLTIVDKPG